MPALACSSMGICLMLSGQGDDDDGGDNENITMLNLSSQS